MKATDVIGYIPYVARVAQRDGLVLRAVVPSVPVTVSYSISPLGRELLGALQAMIGKGLAFPLRAVVERTGIDPERIDDVIIGCVDQGGEQYRDRHHLEAVEFV